MNNDLLTLRRRLSAELCAMLISARDIGEHGPAIAEISPPDLVMYEAAEAAASTLITYHVGFEEGHQAGREYERDEAAEKAT